MRSHKTTEARSSPLILTHSIFILMFAGVFIFNIKTAFDRERVREQVRKTIVVGGIGLLQKEIERRFLAGDSIASIRKTSTNPSVKINQDTGVIELNLRLTKNGDGSNYILRFVPLDQSNLGYWTQNRSSDAIDRSPLIWRCLSAEVFVIPLPTHIPRGTLPARYAPAECR
jgi:hypothetical protein